MTTQEIPNKKLRGLLQEWFARIFARKPEAEHPKDEQHNESPKLPADERWSILIELAAKDEVELRKILRPHEEAGLTWELDAAIISQREQLDQALERLTLFEIELQTGRHSYPGPFGTESRQVTLDSLPVETSLVKLFDSEAFLHFCDSYLYFGVRFLAERFAPAVPAARRKMEQYRLAESNWRPFALSTPPDVDVDRHLVEAFLSMHDKRRTPEEGAALAFLDGFLDKPLDYELWLRGLLAEQTPDQEVRFAAITRGLQQWIERRVEFYLRMAQADSGYAPESGDGDGLRAGGAGIGYKDVTQLGAEFSPEVVFKNSASSLGRTMLLRGRRRPQGGWSMDDPVAARFALLDIYWIARILRATVSSSGSVRYQGTSWIHLLRFRANLQRRTEEAAAILQYEEVLRSIFDFCCDLVQNAILVTEQRVRISIDRDEISGRPSETKRWRYVFDEELGVIEQQRALRSYRNLPSGSPGKGAIYPTPSKPAQGESWSERIKTGKHPRNIIGIALSGGGIRSATFNLGVLQGLQELDLLRQLDYVSSVSGGGFTASWLIANVRRSPHWLGRVTDWGSSVNHLRAYSNYLAPRSGIFSADTWTMGATWIRNAFLIQITGLTWLFVLLLFALGAKPVFMNAGLWTIEGYPVAAVIAVVAGLQLLLTTMLQLYDVGGVTSRKSWTSRWVRWLAVFPAWIGAFFVGSLLWRDATQDTGRWDKLNLLENYSSILSYAWRPWLILLVLTWTAFLLVALFSLRRSRVHAMWIAPLCTGVVYLALAGIFLLDRTLADAGDSESAWCSYAFSPALVLAAYTLAIFIFIGLTGRNSSEGIREWWTRFGAWVGVYALIACGLTAASAFSPHLTASLWSRLHTTVKWAAVLSWAGTVVGGLFAGKSSKTTGDGNKSAGLQMLAVIAGVIFILGSVVLASTLLYLLLWKVFAPDTAEYAGFLTTVDALPRYAIPGSLVVVTVLGGLFSRYFEINIFGLNQFYRNRIVRCYLGASRVAPGTRKPNAFTGFDFKDDIKLHKLQHDSSLDEANGPFRGPFPIVNCALNLAGSADLSVKTRHSASFFLTPLRCGSDRPLVGFAPTASRQHQFGGGIMLGQAVAVSGAAVSPNMGYNTSPLVAFLLTMFNVRLGWWFPNPGRTRWMRSGLSRSLYYLTRELLGLADEHSQFLNVSDGGHFENLAVYELIRRRCKVIVACDAECDENLQFGGLGNLIRICETDFGAHIDLDVKSIRSQKDSYSLAHCAVGQIKYSNGSIGYLIYFKASVTGDEPVSVAQYRSAHLSFPHETTANQFFSEDQFESYRKLGQHVVQHSFAGTVPGQPLVAIAEKLADVLTPAGCASETFLRQSAALRMIWDKFRESCALYPFLGELMGKNPLAQGSATGATTTVREDEICVGLQLIQLMEDVFHDLRLDDFWEHPDNRGWAILFMNWSQSPRFREIWSQSRRTFGIRFEHFCAARLGLPRDRPVVRV